MFIEMARDPSHGGKGWEFGTCVWAPSRKEDGGRWPYWNKVGKVREGDLILHLRGKPPHAAFVGFSIAAGNGYLTKEKPSAPGSWDFGTEFFRADLKDYNPFPAPIPLASVFATRNEELRHYYKINSEKPPHEKRHLFYVVQSGRVQCFNGGYFSDLDSDLADIILGSDFSGDPLPRPSDVSVATGQRIQKMRARVGQGAFSQAVKSNYGYTCCFPSCGINDPALLVGAHIGRWSDREDLRGSVANGLCLCLLHDKAFEEGYFTVDGALRVQPLPNSSDSAWHDKAIKPFKEQPIRHSAIPPSRAALEAHWSRHAFTPSP